jgi:hypothetical protein
LHTTSTDTLAASARKPSVSVIARRRPLAGHRWHAADRGRHDHEQRLPSHAIGALRAFVHARMVARAAQ